MKLRLDQIDAGHLFGHGVLNLDARIALDEVVVAGLGCHQELDGASVDVVRRLHELDRIGENPVPEAVVETRRRRRLDDLLVAQLHGAVAFVKVEDVAGAVGKDLDLDVTRADDQLLDEQAAVAERGLGLTPATLE